MNHTRTTSHHHFYSIFGDSLAILSLLSKCHPCFTLVDHLSVFSCCWLTQSMSFFWTTPPLSTGLLLFIPTMLMLMPRGFNTYSCWEWFHYIHSIDSYDSPYHEGNALWASDCGKSASLVIIVSWKFFVCFRIDSSVFILWIRKESIFGSGTRLLFVTHRSLSLLSIEFLLSFSI